MKEQNTSFDSEELSPFVKFHIAGKLVICEFFKLFTTKFFSFLLEAKRSWQYFKLFMFCILQSEHKIYLDLTIYIYICVCFIHYGVQNFCSQILFKLVEFIYLKKRERYYLPLDKCVTCIII